MLTAARRWSAFRCPTTRRLSWLRGAATGKVAVVLDSRER